MTKEIMAKEIKVPQIAEGADSATVTEILVAEGDRIKKDQSLIVVESDKASVEIPSPESGTVKSINVGEGDQVKVGDVILSLETSDSEESSDDKPARPEDGDQDKEQEESDQPKKEEKKEKEQETEDGKTSQERDKDKETEKKPSDKGDSDEAADEEDEQATETKDSSEAENDEETEKKKSEEDDDAEIDNDTDQKEDTEGSKTEISDDNEKDDKAEKLEESDDDEDKTLKTEVGVAPGVRRLARELGIDLGEVEGSGNGGHISKEDVKAHAKKTNSETDSKKSPSLPDFSRWGETERKSLSGIRSATAKNVSLSWQTIPHVFQFEEAEISGIEKYIDKHSKKTEEGGGKLTLTAVLVKIVAGALRQFPKFNASIDIANDQMILKKYVNIGIAVDTEKGLLVPVLKNVDKKSITEISVELTQLAEKARQGKLGSDEMQGGNFTISNLGGIGGTQFTPIILHPQVAILGVSRAAKKPVYLDGKFGARNILPLSLSYDHRLIDGAEGVRFIDWIARALEDPYSALLEG